MAGDTPHDPKTVTVPLAAKIIGVHPNTVRRWIDEGRLGGGAPGKGMWRKVPLDEVQRMAAAYQQEARGTQP